MKQKKQNTLVKFGEHVASIRTGKGLSLRELATRCDIGHASLSRVEHGKLNITLLSILDLAKGLDVSPKKLFDFEFD